ncbi:MAG: 3-hydroxyacyl-CoA dehydrogenase [Candidatus Lokiarchaeota archaeon]|nr:3-hydroxyacyl-CoA dehydrogenase [Candidatus Lokiarchaeota archaeon]
MDNSNFEVKQLVVIGAGTMGSGIAQAALLADYDTILVDLNKEIVDRGASKIEEGVTKLESKGKLGDKTSVAKIMKRLTTATDLIKAVKDADFIIEAVSEDLEIKQGVFNKLGKYAPEHAILASNTSTLLISKICESTNKPERVIGMHFFVPPIFTGCVELMRGKNTSDKAMEIGFKIAKSLPCFNAKRFPVRIEKETPGFIANRLLIPPLVYTNWIIDKAHEKGVPFEEIDADAGARTLMPMGPCELADYLGLDVMYKSMKIFEQILSPDITPGKVLTTLVAQGKFGKKSGTGLYDWTSGKPEINLTKKAGLLNHEIILAIQLNEGCKLLEEGVVTGYKIIDDVMLTGPGMPGPFSAGKHKYEQWSNMLEELATKINKPYLKPCELMKSGAFIKKRK